MFESLHRKECQYSIDSNAIARLAEISNKDCQAIALRCLDLVQARYSRVDNRMKYGPPKQ